MKWLPPHQNETALTTLPWKSTVKLAFASHNHRCLLWSVGETALMSNITVWEHLACRTSTREWSIWPRSWKILWWKWHKYVIRRIHTSASSAPALLQRCWGNHNAFHCSSALLLWAETNTSLTLILRRLLRGPALTLISTCTISRATPAMPLSKEAPLNHYKSSSSAHVWLVHVLLSSSTVSSIGLELNCSPAINQKPYKIEFQECINA